MSPRVLVVGWSSVVNGEATAGDVLSMRAVESALRSAPGGGVSVDLAWSPVMARAPGAGGVELLAVDPAAYSHLVWACGPLHGRAVAEVAARFAACRRIAVGVSLVTGPAGGPVDGPDGGDLAAWDLVLPRDAPGAAPVRDLSAGPAAALACRLASVSAAAEEVEVLGVCLAPGQAEYGSRRRHDVVTAALGEWLERVAAARLVVDTRLDPRGWRDPHSPAEVLALLRRCDVVVTSRLHGLVLSLAAGVPALALDPVAGGGKVAAQGAAWGWPVLLPEELAADGGAVSSGALDRVLQWCRSPLGREAAAAAALLAPSAGAAQLIALVDAVTSTA